MDSRTKLRLATGADAAFLRELHHRVYREVVVRQFGAWDESAQDGWFEQGLAEAEFSVIEQDGQPVGAVGVKDSAACLHLVELQILPEQQGSGLGSAILRAQLERAQQTQRPIALRVLLENRARSLYARHGFVVTGRTDTHYLMEWRPCELARVQPADHAEHVVLENLLELYIHDLSESFPFVKLGPDGRFGYPELATYWSEPARHFAFLIKESGNVAGFALVTRGSPAVADPNVYDVAEFFVLRACRRSGVGRRAALLLWKELPGTWTVRCSESSPGALTFWTGVVTALTNGDAKISSWAGRTSQFRVFQFDSK